MTTYWLRYRTSRTVFESWLCRESRPKCRRLPRRFVQRTGLSKIPLVAGLKPPSRIIQCPARAGSGTLQPRIHQVRDLYPANPGYKPGVQPGVQPVPVNPNQPPGVAPQQGQPQGLQPFNPFGVNQNNRRSPY